MKKEYECVDFLHTMQYIHHSMLELQFRNVLFSKEYIKNLKDKVRYAEKITKYYCKRNDIINFGFVDYYIIWRYSEFPTSYKKYKSSVIDICKINITDEDYIDKYLIGVGEDTNDDGDIIIRINSIVSRLNQKDAKLSHIQIDMTPGFVAHRYHCYIQKDMLNNKDIIMPLDWVEIELIKKHMKDNVLDYLKSVRKCIKMYTK